MNARLDHAQENATAHMDSIRELVARLNVATENRADDTREAVEQEIQEYPLSCCVRSAWTPVGEPMEATEYEILLSTGGPALRIVGDLNRWNEPENARLEMQDWGTPWSEVHGLTSDDDATLRAFAAAFFWGE